MEKSIKTLKNSEKAITLISLVVTIIVLLILAGISISMLSGDNGILQKATQSKEKTERAEIVENAKLDILAKLSEKKGKNLTASELEEILISPSYSTQGALSSEENILERTLTSKDGKHTIAVSEIFEGTLESKSPTESYGLSNDRTYFIGKKSTGKVAGKDDLDNTQTSNPIVDETGFRFETGHFLHMTSDSSFLCGEASNVPEFPEGDVYLCWDNDYGNVEGTSNLYYYADTYVERVEWDVFSSSGEWLYYGYINPYGN